SIAGLVPGWIHVRGGEIFHAQHGDITGEAALRSLLSQSSGAITTGPLRSEAEASITRSFQSLLLDLLRQLDEGPDEAPQPTALPIEERRPTTFFPPSTEAALDAAFASIGATPSASIAIPAPPPPVSSQAPIATEALGENVGAIMQSMAGDSASASAMIVELATGRVTPLQGEPLPAEQALEATRSLVHLVERLTPDWQHYESLSGSIAVGLIRIQSSQAYLLVIEVMVGKYPIVRFRARLGRLAEVV
ncbi:MAG: DUF4388 domain-containing protein, partial [Myxococcales bacterium]|nr:DUF4388 domain-containing protein [Myxococcales bacterium]